MDGNSPHVMLKPNGPFVMVSITPPDPECNTPTSPFPIAARFLAFIYSSLPLMAELAMVPARSATTSTNECVFLIFMLFDVIY